MNLSITSACSPTNQPLRVWFAADARRSTDSQGKNNDK